MNLKNNSLVTKLAVVLVLKLVILTGLWWGFVREQRVTVDANHVATQFLLASPEQAKGVVQ